MALKTGSDYHLSSMLCLVSIGNDVETELFCVHEGGCVFCWCNMKFLCKNEQGLSLKSLLCQFEAQCLFR